MEALRAAIERGDLSTLKELIKGHSGMLEAWGNRALQDSARLGKVDIVAALLDLGADINATPWYSSSPLEVACTYEQLAVVKLLLARGADTKPRPGNYSPLVQASVNGCEDIVMALLAHGCGDIDYADEHACHESALYLACYMGHAEVVGLLLRAGANPFRPCPDGLTPMQVAMEEENQEPVELLKVR
jgi:ankyrin repeat protein